jgi:DNA-binding response OmpR family regulator
MKRILLVEGNRNIRNLIKRELAKNGFSVLDTADGHEALSQLRDNDPQILIVDIHTKKRKALDAFRSEATKKKVPIIILTSKTPHEQNVSDWDPSFILDRWSCKTPELLGAIEKLSAARQSRKKESQDSTNVSTNQRT